MLQSAMKGFLEADRPTSLVYMIETETERETHVHREWEIDGRKTLI